MTNYLETLGDNVYLSMQTLTFKTAMLMALTQPSQAKQSWQNRALSQFFFPLFSQNEKLFPVITLQAYEEGTKE